MSAQPNHWLQGPPPPKSAQSTPNQYPQVSQAPKRNRGRAPPYRPARPTPTTAGPPGGPTVNQKSGKKLGGAPPLHHKEMCNRRASWAAALPQAQIPAQPPILPQAQTATQPPILPPSPESVPHWAPTGPHMPLGPQLHTIPNVPTNNRFDLLSEQAGN